MPLAEIPVMTDLPATGNLRPILGEIHHALTALATGGVHHVIDLQNLPFAPQELAALDAFLGEGEIDVTLNMLGKTRIRESRYAGVWQVEHFDLSERRIGYCIEIGRVPELLRAQADDIVEALAAMTTTLISRGGQVA